jgi:hypothetical protein
VAELWLSAHDFATVALRSTKREIEIEQSDIFVAGFFRTRGIGFGTIGFQSL